MSRVIDITGRIYEGMWDLEPPFPRYKIRPFPPVPWVKGPVYLESFEMHSQTGTYLETPAHMTGYENARLIEHLDMAELTNRPCVVLDVGEINPGNGKERKPITAEMLSSCKNAGLIEKGDAILFCAHWGYMWEAPEDYLKNSPYLTLDALDWILSHKPYVVGGDIPRWELVDRPQGIFDVIAKTDMLLGGPFVNLEQVSAPKVRLTILPLNIIGTCCTPCRAVITED